MFSWASWCIVCWKRKHQASSFWEWVLTGNFVYLIWMFARSYLTPSPHCSLYQYWPPGPKLPIFTLGKTATNDKVWEEALGRRGRPQNIKQIQEGGGRWRQEREITPSNNCRRNGSFSSYLQKKFLMVVINDNFDPLHLKQLWTDEVGTFCYKNRDSRCAVILCFSPRCLACSFYSQKETDASSLSSDPVRE